MDSRPGRARADLWKDLDEKDIFYLLLAGLIACAGSAQETRNEAGFLLGSEQIPGSTTTAGVPLSVGGQCSFLF